MESGEWGEAVGTGGWGEEETLSRLAERLGVETTYTDWRGKPAKVATDSLVAVLAALGVDASTPEAVRRAWDRLSDSSRFLPPVTLCGASEEGFAAPIVRDGKPILNNEITLQGVESAEVHILPTSTSSEPIRLEATEAAVSGPVAEGCVEVPPEVPVGWYEVVATAEGRTEKGALLVTRIPDLPPRRAWGFMTQLYSLRSRRSWGMGDLHDLGELAAWSARELGADFVLVNPLHAAEPSPPISPSPYLPMSRRFSSPLYLRVEDVPEYATLLEQASRAAKDSKGSKDSKDSKDSGEAVEIDEPRSVAVRGVSAAGAAESPRDLTWLTELAAEMSARSLTLDPLDRDAVWTAKARALEAAYGVPLSDARRKEYDRYLAREGDALVGYATWCALAEEHGPDWRRWPARLHDPASPDVSSERSRLADRVGFHCWLQWQLDQQLEAAQRRAVDAGMSIGIVHDLAVGVHPGGADAWLYQSVFAQGMSVGAPPDEFNQRGQDWGQPPWHPGRLAEAAYGPYRDMLRSILRHSGGLRLDHVLQVSRLWWVPEGRSPADGAYVRYDAKALLAVLNHEADQAGAVLIGEDLGTVDPWVRDNLADHHVLGTSLLWFERTDSGAAKPSRDWRALSLATVGTHDLPPITGFLHGDHVELRNRLGLLTRPADEELADHNRQLQSWLDQLRKEGLLPEHLEPGNDQAVVRALHAFLANTPALLLGVSLADAVGERRTQNQPGTIDEYPNWRVPLADAQGHPVLLDDLPGNPEVTAMVTPLRNATAPT